MSISKYYYDVGKQPLLRNIFDLPNFLDHSRLKQVLSKHNSAEWDMVKVKNMCEKAKSNFEWDRDIYKYTIDKGRFQQVLIDVCFEQSLLPIIASTYGLEYNRIDSANTIFLKTQVMLLLDVGKNKINLADISTFKSQMMELSNEMFTFGQRMYPLYQQFDVNVFKAWMVERLYEHFYPVLYFIYVLTNREQCGDFKCRRIYNLAAFMYVYNTIASLFLIIYSSSNSVDAFKVGTVTDNIYLENLKFGLASIMDAVLRQLDNENILDDIDGTGVSTLSGYYQQVKQLAGNNVMNSNKLVETKNLAVVMQNNLSNYNYNEAANYKEMKQTQTAFYVVIGVMSFVIVGLLYMLYANKLILANIICTVVLLGLCVYALVSIIMRFRDLPSSS